MSAHFKMHVAIDTSFRQSLADELAHAPGHWLLEPGLYIVTAGTYQKLPHLHSPVRLDFFVGCLFDYATEFQWSLRAWAVLQNHYHFVAASSRPANLRKFLGKLHMKTAKQLNLWDHSPRRKCGFNIGTATSHLNVRP
jgi:REP-associated tyrosine transposase